MITGKLLASEGRAISLISRLGHGANDIYWFVLPAVLPIILAEYGFSYTAAGAFLTSFLCAIALFSFISGGLADRVPRGPLIAWSFFLASGALIVSGLLSGFWPFMAMLIVAAIGVGIYHPVAYAVIDIASTSGRGRMFGHYELAGSVGILILFIAHGLLIDIIGWKGIVIIASIPGFFMGWVFYAKRAMVTGKDRVPHATDSADGRRLTRWAVPVFFAFIILRTLSSAAVLNFIPVYLIRGVGFTGTLGGYAAGIIFVGAIGANSFIGSVVDRKGPMSVIVGSSVLLGILLAITPIFSNSWLIFPLLFLLGGSLSAAIPAQNIILSSLSDPSRRGTAFGALMGIMTIANSTGPLFLGIIADYLGLNKALSLASIPVFAGICLMVVVRRLMPKAIDAGYLPGKKQPTPAQQPQQPR